MPDEESKLELELHEKFMSFRDTREARAQGMNLEQARAYYVNVSCTLEARNMELHALKLNKAHMEAKDVELEVKKLRDALRLLFRSMCEYIHFNGVEHEEADCPEDDTCECTRVNNINKAITAARIALVQSEEEESET